MHQPELYSQEFQKKLLHDSEQLNYKFHLGLSFQEPYLKQMHQCCDSTVYAWGNNETQPLYLKNFTKDPLCFGFNKNGSPKHPLYLPNSTQLVPYVSEKAIWKKEPKIPTLLGSELIFCSWYLGCIWPSERQIIGQAIQQELSRGWFVSFPIVSFPKPTHEKVP